MVYINKRSYTYCWWFRNPVPVEVGSLSHYLQGFIRPRWLAGFLPPTLCIMYFRNEHGVNQPRATVTTANCGFSGIIQTHLVVLGTLPSGRLELTRILHPSNKPPLVGSFNPFDRFFVNLESFPLVRSSKNEILEISKTWWNPRSRPKLF